MATRHSRYPEIAAALRARILAGEWEPGARLPQLRDLARQYEANRDTVGRAIVELESEGLVWAVPRRGTQVRHGMSRLRRSRGNLVKRIEGTGEPGYSFPGAGTQEVWVYHVPCTARLDKLTDPRLAGMLGVPAGTKVVHWHSVTGPPGEPPFQTNDSWIHPRGAAGTADVAGESPAPGDWLYRLEIAGHWPIEWSEIYRVRMPAKEEAALLHIPVSLPVQEIVRVGTSGMDGLPIEVTQHVIPGDRVEQVAILRRDENARDPWPGRADSAGAG